MFMFTVKELQERLKTDHATAYALCKSLSSLGIFKRAGTQPQKTGRGRGSTVYRFAEGFGTELESMLIAALVEVAPMPFAAEYRVVSRAEIDQDEEEGPDLSEMDYDPDEDRTP